MTSKTSSKKATQKKPQRPQRPKGLPKGAIPIDPSVILGAITQAVREGVSSALVVERGPEPGRDRAVADAGQAPHRPLNQMEPVPQRAIDSSADYLYSSHCTLEDMVDQLEQRLQPVMSPYPSAAPGTKDAAAGAEGSSCAVSNRFHIGGRRNDELIARLRTMLDNLQV